MTAHQSAMLQRARDSLARAEQDATRWHDRHVTAGRIAAAVHLVGGDTSGILAYAERAYQQWQAAERRVALAMLAESDLIVAASES